MSVTDILHIVLHCSPMHTIDVLLRILDVVGQKVRKVVVQVLQQLHCVINEEDCVVLTKQHPFVAVQANGLIGQEGSHCRPA